MRIIRKRNISFSFSFSFSHSTFQLLLLTFHVIHVLKFGGSRFPIGSQIYIYIYNFFCLLVTWKIYVWPLLDSQPYFTTQYNITKISQIWASFIVICCFNYLNLIHIHDEIMNKCMQHVVNDSTSRFEYIKFDRFFCFSIKISRKYNYSYLENIIFFAIIKYPLNSMICS